MVQESRDGYTEGGAEKSLQASNVVTKENQLNVLKTMNKQTAGGPVLTLNKSFDVKRIWFRPKNE
jgi:hypothetical protein